MECYVRSTMLSIERRQKQKETIVTAAATAKKKKKWEREISLTMASEGIKHLGIYLTKELTDLYTENYKALLEEIKEDIWMESHPVLVD